MSCNYGSPQPRAHALQQEKPLQWEACTPQLEKARAQQWRPNADKETEIYLKRNSCFSALLQLWSFVQLLSLSILVKQIKIILICICFIMCEVKGFLMSTTDICITTPFVSWLSIASAYFFLWVLIFLLCYLCHLSHYGNIFHAESCSEFFILWVWLGW